MVKELQFYHCLLLLYYYIYWFIFVCFACMYVWTPHTHKGQTADLLKLQFPMVGNHCVGAGTRTQVLYEDNLSP